MRSNPLILRGIAIAAVALLICASSVSSISGHVGRISSISEDTVEQKPFLDIPPDEEWNVTFGGSLRDVGMSVEQTTDGGYIITGVKDFNYYDESNIWLIKTDDRGNKEWDKTFGSKGHDSGHSVQQTSEGGYIIAGRTWSYGSGDYDVWLVKTDGDGNEMWNKTFGGINMDTGDSVLLTTQEGYTIVGYTESYDIGGGDVWLIKTDIDGNEKWNKTFGGAKGDFGNAIQQTNDAGYIITGCTESFGSGYFDVWLVKTDGDGNEMWNKTFGGPERDYGFEVLQTTDGGYVIAGTKSYGAGEDIWLIKTDGDGNEMWNKTFGGNDDDLAYSVRQTNDERYIITGYTYSYAPGYASDLWLIKTDSYGNKLWDKTFGSSSGSKGDEGHAVQQSHDGGYIVVGTTQSYGSGDYDVWLIKVAPFENQRPSVEFVNPREGYFHFSGIPLFPTALNLIADNASFGGFRLKPIQVNATDENSKPGELMVTLFINGEDKGYGIWNPDTGFYEWKWTGWALGTYNLRVKAKDMYGGEGWASMDVWNFYFIP
ncbi:MAG: hypothetical protein ACOC80_07205 [Petrotogales bacterium]